MEEIAGFLGMVMIIAGWIPQTLEAWKNKKFINRKFAVLYAIGSLLLTLHAYNLNDWVFVILNATATFIAVLNIIFGLTER